MTNRSGTDLNAVCSSLAEARPMDGPSNERSQRTCSLKYDGYKRTTYHDKRTQYSGLEKRCRSGG
ncbi:hypothetical protein DVQ85_09320 [Yersinia enterocolitica]|nr:hypothetical protein [Yersinia enterocolitica]EKN5989515.1 hypothetical protein [Yersinia enterocolitica]